MTSAHPFKDYPGGNRIKRIGDLEVEGKRVFVRVDFNVPMKDGVITDDTRIRAALPTLKYLIEKGAKVICASHFGRPKGVFESKYSLAPVAERLGELLQKDVLFSDNCVGDAVVNQAKNLKNEILLLENLRFHKGEEGNDPDFCHKLSQFADVYVNDAFGASHRAHASISGLPKMLTQKAPGFLLEKEIAALGKLIYNPDRPLVSILGGSKVSDKIKVIEALMVKSSKILIGGAMAYTFLRALKVETGNSRVETEQVSLAARLLERSEKASCKLILPVDHMTGESFDNPGTAQATTNAHIPAGRMGLDIGPKTIELFRRELQGAASIFWNGPLGVFEKKPFHEGSFAVAKMIAEHSAHTKICGGGDSVAAVNESGSEAGFTHISTGGGASLEMIEGIPMPGIESLKP